MPFGCGFRERQWILILSNQGYVYGYSVVPCVCVNACLCAAKKALKSCWGPNDSYKTMFWWVNCKWIKNIWIKFDLMCMDLKIRRKMPGKGNFDFTNPKVWGKYLEMFNDPTQENVACCPSPFYKIIICWHTWHQKSPWRQFYRRQLLVLDKILWEKFFVYL